MRAVVEIWLKSLIDEFTLGGLHSAMEKKQTNATNVGLSLYADALNAHMKNHMYSMYLNNIHSVSKPYPPISRYYPWIRTSVSKNGYGYVNSRNCVSMDIIWILNGYNVDTKWIQSGYVSADILWIHFGYNDGRFL